MISFEASLSIVAVLMELIIIYTLSDLGDLSNNKQQQQNVINKKNKITEVLPSVSKAIRGGTMRVIYRNKD